MNHEVSDSNNSIQQLCS